MTEVPDLNLERIARVNNLKRSFDLVVCVLLLPFALPVALVVAISLVIRQGRPVLFTQERLGYKEQVFRVYKFRTMLDTRDSEGNLLPDAERLTKVGRFLRKTSLDELPQLFNVLKGDMSFVGPRPLFVRYKDYYTLREATRHLVRPGITGLAQVNGRNNLKWDARLELDASYVERVSFRLDIGIAVRTFLQVFRNSNVVVTARESGYPLDVFRTFPQDDRFRMRLLEFGDLATRAEWMSHPETRHYMRLDDDITLESTLAWFKNRNKTSGRIDFVIEDTETKSLVAMTGLRDRTPDTTESYVFVKPDAKGRGYGTAAQRMLLDWAFGSGKYRYVVSSIHPENAASFRIHNRYGGEIRPVGNGRSEIWVSADDFRASTGKRT